MATRMAAEVAADAILIGRYFGRPAAAMALSRPAPSTGAALSIASRTTPSGTEGDGPGVRMMASSGNSMGAGMFAAASASAGSVRFMSMLGGRRAADSLLAEAIAKYF